MWLLCDRKFGEVRCFPQIFKSFLSRWKIHLDIFDIEDRTTHTFSVGSFMSEQFCSYLCDFCRQMKHAVDSSDGLKHAFDAQQQTHGAETSSPGGLGVTLRVERKGGGQAGG